MVYYFAAGPSLVYRTGESRRRREGAVLEWAGERTL